ncbi:MAG TPA: hypothetical protein PKD53_15840 [Chloroflexaceae bacterium]|nr:hypothetical protein [Chloroflexaceae bacterium]
MRYFIHLTRRADGYAATIHQGNPALGRTAAGLALGPEAPVRIREREVPLGEVARALAAYDNRALAALYDEHGQFAIGHHLYRQLFGDAPPESFRQHPDDPVDLRIVADDEEIPRLPWALLAHKGVFLVAAGWSITLASTGRLRAVELPAAPRLLLVAPEPADQQRTRAEAHLEELEFLLSLHDRALSGERVRRVRTWAELREALPAFEPDLIYYYGHGRGDSHRAVLAFADELGRLDERPVADLAQLIGALPRPPLLVYLNCCSGDAGGFLGAGWQIGQRVPAVLANRTLVEIDAAQAQAIVFWRTLLVERRAPHLALASLYGKVTERGLSFRDARWLTPVLYCHYDGWAAPPLQRAEQAPRDPHWHLKLDRVVQFSIVSAQTRQMLRERRPRSLAYIWYGEPGQGVDRFHTRLQVELETDPPQGAQIVVVRPEWPPVFDLPRDYEAMLVEAFEGVPLRSVSASLKARARGGPQQPVILYVRHRPVRGDAKDVVNPYKLRSYLQWWDQVFVPRLAGPHHALLTIPFEVERPARFRAAVLEGARLRDLELGHTIFRLLDEMERLALSDLLDFLQMHEIRLPRAARERVLQAILTRTGGHYDQTVSELRRIVESVIHADDAPQPASDAPILDY